LTQWSEDQYAEIDGKEKFKHSVRNRIRGIIMNYKYKYEREFRENIKKKILEFCKEYQMEQD
jgi:hypothetical protein